MRHKFTIWRLPNRMWTGTCLNPTCQARVNYWDWGAAVGAALAHGWKMSHG